MAVWLQTLLTVLTTVLASNGFWTLLQYRREGRDKTGKLLRGIAHDRIISLGEKALSRGQITSDEYENLYDYLYLPYKALGGNGSAERIVEQVKQLPIRKDGSK